MLEARLRICHALGMTYDAVAAMSREEQAMHLAWLRLHPPQADMINFAQARIITATLNSAFGSKGGAKVGDFLLDFFKEVRPRTPRECKELMLAWAHAANAVK